MMETREEVFAVCRDYAQGGSQARAIAAYYHDPLTSDEPAGRAAFGKLVGFFCNLEICLRAGLLNTGLACALFGEAHYVDYRPLIAGIRDIVREEMPPGQPLPQWLQMTINLEERFCRKGLPALRVPPSPETGSRAAA